MAIQPEKSTAEAQMARLATSKMRRGGP